MGLFGKKDKGMGGTESPEERLIFFRRALNREPTVEEMDIALRVHKLSWKEYCNKMIERTQKEIELEKERQKTEKTRTVAYKEAGDFFQRRDRQIERAQRQNAPDFASAGAGIKRMEREALEVPKKDLNYYNSDLYKKPGCPNCGSDRFHRLMTGGFVCRNCSAKFAAPVMVSPKNYVTAAAKNTVNYLQSETERMPRAIAWGKRKIDGMASEVARKYDASSKLNDIKKELDIDTKRGVVENLGRQIDALNKKRDELVRDLENQKNTPPGKYKLLESIENTLDRTEQRLNTAMTIAEEANNKYAEYARGLSDELNVLRAAMQSIVPGVLEETCATFRIISSELREEVRYSLEKFADEEAAHMIERGNQSIYSGLGRIKKFTHGAAGYGKSASGTFAKTSDVMGMFTDATLGLLLGPAVIGALLVVAMGWEMDMWGPSTFDIPLLMWIFVPVLIVVMIELGKSWR